MCAPAANESIVLKASERLLIHNVPGTLPDPNKVGVQSVEQKPLKSASNCRKALQL